MHLELHFVSLKGAIEIKFVWLIHSKGLDYEKVFVEKNI